MTRHLLKLIWNRKRSNILVIAEILASFLVLFVVTTLALFYWDNYRQPLGYRYDDVWRIQVDRKRSGLIGAKEAAAAETGRRLLLAVQELPEVEAVAGAFASPYTDGSWSSAYEVDGRHHEYELSQVTDAFKEVVGLELTQGRWFSKQDDAVTGYKPVVVNERLSRLTFGGGDPIGRNVPQDKDRDGRPRAELRVIGVVRDFRQHGEFSAPGNYLFQRQRVDGSEDQPSELLVLRVRPGTTAAFEEPLMKVLQGTAKEWSFKVESLAEMREANHRERLAPIVALGVVAGFQLMMVALGLTGVLWQNVTQRTREIGLRRAKGASIGRIHAQVLGEIAVMTSLALAVGVVIVVQFPLLDLMGFVRPGVFAGSLAVSVAAIYVLTVVCGLYPSRLATRLSPAEALHYE